MVMSQLPNENLVASSSSQAGGGDPNCRPYYAINGVIDNGDHTTQNFCSASADLEPWFQVDMIEPQKTHSVSSVFCFGIMDYREKIGSWCCVLHTTILNIDRLDKNREIFNCFA